MSKEDKKFLNQLFDFLKLVSGQKRSVVWLMTLGAVTGAALPFLDLFFSAEILNCVLEQDYEKSIRFVAVILIGTFALGLIHKACSQTVQVFQDSCRRGVEEQAAYKAFTMEYEELEKEESLDHIRRIRNGENSMGGVDRQIEAIYQFMQQIATAVFSLVFVGVLFVQKGEGKGGFFASPFSTLLLLGVILVASWLLTRLNRYFNRILFDMEIKNEKLNMAFCYLMDLALDYKKGKDIRLFAQQKLVTETYDEMVAGEAFYDDYGRTMGRIGMSVSLFSRLLSMAAYLLVAGKALNGIISVGEIVLYAGAVNRFSQAMTELSQIYGRIAFRFDFLKLYGDYIKRPNMRYDGTLPVEKRSDARYQFEFQDVSFHYPGCEEPVLEHVDLKLTIGETLAVVGKNGAGKSSLIKLLCRLYEPTEGKILLNGIDISLYDYEEYTTIFSVVFQDFHLFSLPLAENVAGSGQIDEARLDDALQKAGMKERVDELPEGASTLLYHDTGSGVELSGGEAQKLAIARALYKDAPFVILDEPTASLDPIAEAEIYEQFDRLIHGKTAVYISHRMSSCRFCDRIVVFDQGKIVEQGTHEELLKHCGIYEELYRTQAQYYA